MTRRLHLTSALLPEGWADDVALTLEDGIIVQVETGVRPAPGDRTLAGAALPGLPNLHSHAFQRGMAGFAERASRTEESFWTWRETMYRFLARLDPDAVEAIAAMAYVEMLEAGFTSVGEFHYLHNQPDGRAYADPAEMALRHVAAAQETGIGLTLLPVAYMRGGFLGAAPSEGQRRFVTTPDGFARLHQRAAWAVGFLPNGRIGVAPHSLRAVTLDELTALVAAHPTGPVHIHVSEQEKEVADCLAAHGRRPIELLADTVALDERWCLIHATHADAGEVGAMARAGIVVGLCPITEANLGDGLFPAGAFLKSGGRFGVGSDSNVRISAAEELRTLDYGQRLLTRRRTPLTPPGASSGRALWEAAVNGGAQALDIGLSGIQPGARADLVMLDSEAIAHHARGGDDLLDALVYAGGGGRAEAVRHVVAHGRLVVVDGRHIAREAIETRFRAALAKALAA